MIIEQQLFMISSPFKFTTFQVKYIKKYFLFIIKSINISNFKESSSENTHDSSLWIDDKSSISSVL